MILAAIKYIDLYKKIIKMFIYYVILKEKYLIHNLQMKFSLKDPTSEKYNQK